MSHHKPQLFKYLNCSNGKDLSHLDLSQFRVYRGEQKTDEKLTPLLYILQYNYNNFTNKQIDYLVRHSNLNATRMSRYSPDKHRFNALFLALLNHKKYNINSETIDYLIKNTDLHFETPQGVKALYWAILGTASLTSEQWSALINAFFNPEHFSQKSADYLFHNLENQNQIHYYSVVKIMWKKLMYKDFFIDFMQKNQNTKLYNNILSLDFIEVYIQKKNLEECIATHNKKSTNTLKI